jgi:hypothetical protein
MKGRFLPAPFSFWLTDPCPWRKLDPHILMVQSLSVSRPLTLELDLASRRGSLIYVLEMDAYGKIAG